jgi:phage anti-repressor protein
MNNQLIPVFAGEISGVQVQLVDGRLLHSFLESAQHFANWIASRIEDYGFIENQDFLINLLKTKGRPSKEYSITIDMAKELGMIERNEKGRQIRRYFLEMERIAKSQLSSNPAQLPKTPPERKTRKALPGCLTLEHQDNIKALVKGMSNICPLINRLGKSSNNGRLLRINSAALTKKFPTRNMST